MSKMKQEMVLVIMIPLVLMAAFAPAVVGIGEGWSEYVTVVVSWDGNPANQGNWKVLAGPYYVVLHPTYSVGQFVTGCTACLDMSSYSFTFTGSTLQFSETYVSGVEAFPQTHHVVLHTSDGVTYTGSITARYDFPGSPAGQTRMDVIQYTVVTSSGQVTSFTYNEVEYVQTHVP